MRVCVCTAAINCLRLRLSAYLTRRCARARIYSRTRLAIPTHSHSNLYAMIRCEIIGFESSYVSARHCWWHKRCTWLLPTTRRQLHFSNNEFITVSCVRLNNRARLSINLFWGLRLVNSRSKAPNSTIRINQVKTFEKLGNLLGKQIHTVELLMISQSLTQWSFQIPASALSGTTKLCVRVDKWLLRYSSPLLIEMFWFWVPQLITQLQLHCTHTYT